MGSIDLYNERYIWNSDSGCARTREILYNGLFPTKTFLKHLQFTKSIKEFGCHICGSKKPKNTRYVGDSWRRICQDCSNEWCENSIDSLKKMIKLIEETKINLKENEKDWKKEMILGALK